MKILLFGPSSSLGQSFIKAAKRRNHSIYCISNNSNEAQSWSCSEPNWIHLDFSNFDSIQQLIFSQWPEVIVNCLDRSDSSEEKAVVQINVHLPKLLAQISHHLNTRFIHISNYQIFDGSSRAPYRSTDKPSPTSFYGQSKLLGEKEVLKNNTSDPVIIRVPDLLGHSLKQDPNSVSFNEHILNTLQSSGKINVSKNHFLQPTTANNVADLLVELSERRDLNGIFHWAGSERIDAFRLVKLILENANIEKPEEVIELVEADQEKNFSMELDPLKGKVKTKALNIQEQFEDLNYIEPLRID